jgi:5-(carboxyamino)imidazole ribonucleotide mutase
MTKVTIIMSSDQDRHIADRAVEVLSRSGVEYEVQKASMHHEPGRVKQVVDYSNADIFICISGLSAALPGFVAGITKKPVIGVPVSHSLGGLDALLSMSQTPSGVPVATVGIDNGHNAAHLALRMLGVRQTATYDFSPETKSYESNEYDFPLPTNESHSLPKLDYSLAPKEEIKDNVDTTPLFSMFGAPPSSSSSPERNAITRRKRQPRGDWL